MAPSSRKPPRLTGSGSVSTEWTGGVLHLESSERGMKPIRAGLAIWCEKESGVELVNVAEETDDPDALLVIAYRQAVAAPLVGPPRVPTRIVVKNKNMARMMRAEVGPDVDVVVGSPPDFKQLSVLMSAHVNPVDEFLYADPSGSATTGPTTATAPPSAPGPSLGVELVETLFHVACHRFGAALDRAQDDFQRPEAAEQLLPEWALFHFRIKGRTPAEFFLADGPPDDMRKFIEAQRLGWLSIWEVETVDRGSSFTARDHLTGIVRRVEDRMASESLLVRHSVLGRIVEWEGRVQFWGVHSTPLPPHAALPVVDAMRRHLKIGKVGLAPVQTLRWDRSGRFLIARWEDAIEQLEAARRNPPRMVTRDGEDVLLVSVTYGFDAVDRKRIAEALSKMDGTVAPPVAQQSAPECEYVVCDPARAGAGANLGDADSMIGIIRLAPRELKLEANSRQRFTAIERRLAAAVGPWIREMGRTEVDPRQEYLARLSRGETGKDPRSQIQAVPPSELIEIVRAHKRDHYTKWMDESIPALGGKTPRAAARTARGREELDRLLRDIEYHEARQPEWDRFDFSALRRDLGI